MTGLRQAPRGRIARGLTLGISLICASRLAAAEEGERSRWALQVSGFTHHFEGTHNRAHPSWNSVNSGVGVQYDWRGDAASRWSTVLSVGEMKDSYGVVGPYAGIALQYRLNDARIRTRLGLGAFLAWRALDWTGTRKLTFLPMPVLSVEDSATGLGFNLAGTPSIHYDNHKIVSFIFIQGTYRF